jgi:protein-S-isoprenylcysteine O-methyltransferase Ste14
MHGWSRNMNYVGEIMLYASFGIIVQRWEVWAVYSYMWGIIFMIRMSIKDHSLSKKQGWQEYKDKTWMLLPKLCNSTLWSCTIYLGSLAGCYFTY